MGILKRLQHKVFDPAVEKEIEEKLAKIPNKLNELGFDNWGMHLDSIKKVLVLLKWLFEKYFRVEVHGIEKVPQGRVLIVANHGGQLPVDACLICYALCMCSESPRIVRSMADRFMPRLPFISTFLIRCGQVIGTPENCKSLLENDEAVLVFPEGTRGSGKLYWKRYQLQEFGSGFMRLALETETPIVPVAVIGAEEIYPAFYNWKSLARFLRLPYFPITPFFPILGPVGAIPIPAKVHLYFGDPLTFSGDFDGSEYEIQKKVSVVASCIRDMIQKGLKQRKKIFS